MCLCRAGVQMQNDEEDAIKLSELLEGLTLEDQRETGYTYE